MSVNTTCDVPSCGIPHSNSGVEADTRDSHPIERDRVDLVEVTSKDMETRPRLNVPHATGTVVAPAHDAPVAHVEAAHALLVPLKRAQQSPTLDVPHTHGAVARTRNSERAAMEDLEAADGGGVAGEDVYTVT